jgi:HK97 gp10 family phage protein
MISAKVRGIPELKAALGGLVPKLRRQVLRNALAAGARLVRDEARRRAPVLQPTLRAPYRKPETVRKAISVRTSKIARRAGDVGVFVNVRPAKRGQRGAKNPNDPFYWRFVNWGTKAHAKGSKSGYTSRARLIVRRHTRSTGKTKAAKFMEAGVGMLPAALQIFKVQIGPQIAKLNKPKAPAP